MKNWQLLPGIKDGVFTLTLTELETEALLDILLFAKNAATLVAQQEQDSGKQISRKMLQFAADSKELIDIILDDLEVGVPTKEQIN